MSRMRYRGRGLRIAGVLAITVFLAACGNGDAERIDELEQQLQDAEAQLEQAGWSSGAGSFDAPVALSVDSLAGIWHMDGTQILVRFSEDGTYAIDDRGNLDTDPRDTGRYVIDGMTVTFTSGDDSSFCSPGSQAVWRDAGMTHLDRIEGTVAADECFVGGVGAEITLSMVSSSRG